MRAFPFLRFRHSCLWLMLFVVPALGVRAQAPPDTSAPAAPATQSPLDPARLPERTTFYFIWHGAPAEDLRKTNSLFRLWDDPDFAPARTALLEHLFSRSEGKSAANNSITQEELQKYLPLLENSFLFGMVGDPSLDPESHKRPADDAMRRPWNGFFFVYDRTGKEALLTRAVIRSRAAEKDPPRVSATEIAGKPVVKLERQSGVSYWVEQGNYIISAGEPSTIEKFLNRMDPAAPPVQSLGDSAAFREAQPLFGGGLLEFFVGIPHLAELAPNANAGGVRVGPLLDALKMDSLHSIAGRVSLDGANTRFQAALLGDTAEGTLFDLWDTGRKTPASLAFVTPETVSYNEAQINVPGLYAILKQAVQTLFPRSQQNDVSLFEVMAKSRLGMPLEDVVKVPSGEFASLQPSADNNPAKRVYFLGINQKPEALRLLRSILGERLSSERTEGDTTFLKVSMGGGNSKAGIAQWNFFNFAVTPDLIVVTQRSEDLRQQLAKRKAASSLPAAFQSARTRYPEFLTGVGFVDLQKMDWTKLRSANRGLNLVPLAAPEVSEQFQETPKTQTKKKAVVIPQQPGIFDKVNLDVFPRYLHFASSASWKDAQGFHVEGWLE